MENRNELDLGLMTTEDMKSVEKVFEEQNDTEMRSASAVAAGAGYFFFINRLITGS